MGRKGLSLMRWGVHGFLHSQWNLSGECGQNGLTAFLAQWDGLHGRLNHVLCPRKSVSHQTLFKWRVLSANT